MAQKVSTLSDYYTGKLTIHRCSTNKIEDAKLPKDLSVGSVLQRQCFAQQPWPLLSDRYDGDDAQITVHATLQENAPPFAISQTFLVTYITKKDAGNEQQPEMCVAKFYNPLYLSKTKLCSVTDGEHRNKTNDRVELDPVDPESSDTNPAESGSVEYGQFEDCRYGGHICARADEAFYTEVRAYAFYEANRNRKEAAILPEFKGAFICSKVGSTVGSHTHYIPVILLEHVSGNPMSIIRPSSMTEDERKKLMIAGIKQETALYAIGIEQAEFTPCSVMFNGQEVRLLNLTDANLLEPEDLEEGLLQKAECRWHHFLYSSMCEPFHMWIRGPTNWSRWMEEAFGKVDPESREYKETVAGWDDPQEKSLLDFYDGPWAYGDV